MLFARINKVTAKHDKRSELAAILTRISDLILSPDSVHLYVISEDLKHCNVLWIQEVWKSKEQHERAHGSPEVLQLMKRASALVEARPETSELNVIRSTAGY